MQENEFEKQVRQRMGAFQLQPTDAVWQKLHLQVAKGKERKRKYVIFSFLLVALLGSALLLNDLKRQTASVNKIAEKKSGENPLQKDAGSNLQQPQQTKETPAEAVFLSANSYTGNKKQQQKFIFLANNKTSHHKIKRTTRGTVKIEIASAIVAEDEEAANDNVSGGKEHSFFKDMAVENKTKSAIKIIEQNEILIATALQQPSVKENKEPIKATQTAPKKEKTKLWATSFSLAVGRSSTDSKYLDVGSAAYYNYSGVGSTPNSGVFYQPAATKPGFSFSAGFEVSCFLSAKTTLGTGLQYKLFTTSIATGEKVNTAAASGSTRQQVFKSGSSNRYTSFYHFITVPVSFSTQIATIKTREINLTAGINFLRLVHTNALQFDYTQENYYRDNSVFNKTQVGLSTAFFINLGGKNKAPFYIGPDFYYSPTPQAASGMYIASHYKSFGIQIKKML